MHSMDALRVREIISLHPRRTEIQMRSGVVIPFGQSTSRLAKKSISKGLTVNIEASKGIGS